MIEKSASLRPKIAYQIYRPCYTEDFVPPILSSRETIRNAAINLAHRLEAADPDEKGKAFTDRVFSTLRKFCEEELSLDPKKDCSHRGQEEGRTEFLWDFIAQQADTGLLLVAESEQNAYTKPLERLLKPTSRSYFMSMRRYEF